MQKNVEQYTLLLTELLLTRELEGILEDKVESDYADRLEHLWWQMTAQEQASVEAHLTRIPSAPQDLGLVDREATSGVIPRVPR